ncbi:tRNA (uracil-5-)-methyltransferase [Kluyveromyces marxianus]|uniref:tRNA (Uracil-5-)-methyltransferase n=1 Tax=Kluyveromyces marxianus TaxID=4911 RepID=A0ABX6ENR6_KLUMA|nr:tRNA (uracil-5-)-methyltransferase [Kluyveromyces marxianus]
MLSARVLFLRIPLRASSTIRRLHHNIMSAEIELKRVASQEIKPVKVKQSKKGKIRKYKSKPLDPTSSLGVLQFEIDEILKEQNLTRENILTDVGGILNEARDGPMHKLYHREVDNVEILRMSASGDGLALIPNPAEHDKKQIALIPFGVPGDIVKIKTFKTHPYYVECDLLQVYKPGDMRKDELIQCKYFGKCSGCQLQYLTYDDQLAFKKRTVVNAYKFFAPRLMQENVVPEVGDTVQSPLEVGYRTKLTPHFDLPKWQKENGERPALGFGHKGRPQWRGTAAGGSNSILDIEECIIGTKIINRGMANERARFEKEFSKYTKGATILLREHTKVIDPETPVVEQLDEGSRDAEGNVSYLEIKDTENNKSLVKTCVTNTRQIVTEYINGYTFQFSAGEFFQNNNSILTKVTDYVRKNLQIEGSKPEDPHYLVDAYCGSGLFSITSSKGVDKVIGVEVSADSVAFAERNAKANGVENCKFIVGKAEKIFGSIDTPCDRTSVILDPPRKGCDDIFLKQLAEYNPARIVYISCNVHSQARDVEYFLKETENGKHYKIESLRGFDFFPQTHHVESVCVLIRS